MIKLTAREVQILNRVMRGMTNKEIALDLELADSTIKSIIKSSLKKTHTTNRTAFAMWGVDRGYYSKSIS